MPLQWKGRTAAGVLAAAIASYGLADNVPAPPGTANIETRWFDNGVKQSEVRVVDGKKAGFTLHWYQSGCLMSLHHYVDGLMHGPMVKWENCEDVIAIGEYRRGLPWKGYFLVNPATASPLTDERVHESVLPYFVIRYRDGEAFSGLTQDMLERYLDDNPEFRTLIEQRLRP